MKNAKLWMAIAVGLIAVWGVSGVMILLNGEAAMGTTDRVPWGGMIGGYEFFAVMSTGLCMIAAMGIVFNFERLKQVSRRAMVLAVITIVSGFSIIGLELGRPLNAFYLLLSPNPTSPIWWMVMIYGLYLGLIILTVYSMYKFSAKTTKQLATASFVAALIAVSNIGGLFGMVNARPHWASALLPIYFIIGAILSAAAFLLVVMYFVRKVDQVKGDAVLVDLKKIYALTLGLTAIMVLVKSIAGQFGGVYGKYEATMALLAGPLSIYFWVFEVAIGMAIPLLILLFVKNASYEKLALAGGMTLLGIFFMRYDFVVAGQIVPLKVVDGLKEVVYHSYHTAIPAWGVIIGSFGICLLLTLLAEQKLSLDAGLPEDQESRADKTVSAQA